MLIRKSTYGTEVKLVCKVCSLDRKPKEQRLVVRPGGQIEYWDAKLECWLPASVSALIRQRAYNWADYGK